MTSPIPSAPPSSLSKPPRALVVADVGFGDAGKGTIVDYLARIHDAHTVIRFNGGAQAGHNVVTSDGRHHTFSQLGSATFVPGVRTHLSRFMVLHPLALLIEAQVLAQKGVPDALDRLTISDGALVITPFQQASGRLRELARRSRGHGTCGVGVGETVYDTLRWPQDVVRARDLDDPKGLSRKLLSIQTRKRAELDETLRSLQDEPRAQPEKYVLESREVIDKWVEALAPLRARHLVIPDALMRLVLQASGTVLFEGAQGFLLDEWRGFHPYTTWSTCSFDNALQLLGEHSYQGSIQKIAVLRTYTTRHGPGPLPTETPRLLHTLKEPHNDSQGWQGGFRAGWLDLVLTRYALSLCQGADLLALTHLDAIKRIAFWRACSGYRLARREDSRLFEPRAPGDPTHKAIRPGPPMDLAYQESLTRALMTAEPVYDELELGDKPARGFAAWIQAALNVPVGIESFGPTAGEKRLTPAARSLSRS